MGNADRVRGLSSKVNCLVHRGPGEIGLQERSQGSISDDHRHHGLGKLRPSWSCLLASRPTTADMHGGSLVRLFLDAEEADLKNAHAQLSKLGLGNGRRRCNRRIEEGRDAAVDPQSPGPREIVGRMSVNECITYVV